MKLRKAVIFDVDRTLTPYDAALPIQISKALYRRHLISFRVRFEVMSALCCHVFFRRFNLMAFFPSKARLYLRNAVSQMFSDKWNRELEGRKIADLDAAAKDAAKRVKIRPGVEDFMSYLKKRGYTLVLNSLSPELAVQALAERIGADYGLGTETIAKHGKANGGACKIVMSPEGKAKKVANFLKSKRLIPYAVFGDSPRDEPVLSLSSINILVNPRRDLSDYIKRSKDKEIMLIKDFMGPPELRRIFAG